MKKEEEEKFTLIEGNLIESPIFTFGKDTRKEVEFSWKKKDKLGNIIEEKISIKAPLGLPSSFDQDVLNATMYIHNYQRKTGEYSKKEIHFTDYEIAKTLQIPFETARLKRIKESYMRMLSTTIIYEKSFFESGEKITRGVHLLANVEHYEKMKGKRKINMTKITLDDILVNSIDRKYYNLIEFDKYLALPSGLPRRLYEYLEKKKYKKKHFEIGIKKLAQRLPLKTKRVDKIKIFLDNANEKLKKLKVITGWKFTEKSNNIIYYFTKSAKFKEVERDLFFLDELVKTFYKSIGSTNISSAQVNHGQVVLQDLIDEGYSEDEIKYSLKWVVDNIPDIYSIGILPKVIGQALGDKEGQEKLEEHQKAKQLEEEKEREKLEKEKEELKKLDKKFEKLSTEEKNEIESLATKNLMEEMPGLDRYPNPMIRIKRNMILKERLKSRNQGFSWLR